LDLFSSYYQNMLHAVLADPTIKIDDITLI
jgi:hypothetical protein